MQRVLDPAQIEAFAQRSIPRLRPADPATVFLRRAERLRRLSEGHALGEYLALMGALCEGQHRALRRWASRPEPESLHSSEGRARIACAREHGLPILQAVGWRRDEGWQVVLRELCEELPQGAPTPVRTIGQRLKDEGAVQLEAQADCVLAADSEGLDLQSAPFVSAALQVYWVRLVMALGQELIRELEARQSLAEPGAAAAVCPICGSLPLASIVRADPAHQGYRYLHCALCASEWHFVRIKCSHCLATEGIRYHYLEGGSDAIRAESCESCRTYRKILYQEKDPAVEPLADDLGSLALDLLLSAENYHRSGGNPLLWQPPQG